MSHTVGEWAGWKVWGDRDLRLQTSPLVSSEEMLALLRTLITHFRVKTGPSATEVVSLDFFVFPDFCL